MKNDKPSPETGSAAKHRTLVESMLKSVEKTEPHELRLQRMKDFYETNSYQNTTGKPRPEVIFPNDKD